MKAPLTLVLELAVALLLPLGAACGPVHRTGCVAAVSDLHLGDPRSLLGDEAGRELLLEAVRVAVRKGGVRTLVLNGDVLELSLASETSAYEAAKPVFEGLAKIRGLERVIVLIGNHDHRLYEELPGTPAERLGYVFESGTKVHEALAGSTGKLSVAVTYPDWPLRVKGGGTVHFTHGHYFDPVVTPSFEDAATWETLETKNQDWYQVLNAGGKDPVVRAAYRAAYHFGHHVAAVLDDLTPGGEHGAYAVDLTDRETSRVTRYVHDVLQDTTTVAVVAGHSHHGGGLVERVAVGSQDVTLYDTGGWVVGHHDRPPRPFLYLLDPKRADMRLIPIVVPDEVIAAARARAFAGRP